MLDMRVYEGDRLLALDETKKVSGADHSTKYPALRIKQGELLGIRSNNRWKTSPVAIDLYREIKGRG